MRIVLADDHRLVREALVPFVQRVRPEVKVDEADTLQEALESAAQEPAPALIILDFRMPGMNGVTGVRAARRQFPDVPLVVLSGTANRHEALSTMRAGVEGFVPKSLNGESMVNALRLVLSGERYFPSFLFAEGGEEEAARPSLSGVGGSLSPLEQDALNLLVEGLSNKEIAQRLSVQEVTVKKRLSSAYRKLGVSNRVQAVQVVSMAGQTV